MVTYVSGDQMQCALCSVVSHRASVAVQQCHWSQCRSRGEKVICGRRKATLLPGSNCPRTYLSTKQDFPTPCASPTAATIDCQVHHFNLRETLRATMATAAASQTNGDKFFLPQCSLGGQSAIRPARFNVGSGRRQKRARGHWGAHRITKQH